MSTFHALAQTPAPAKTPDPPPTAPAASTPAIEYKPPAKGAPRGRIGGGTRGAESRELVMAVIAPDHTGWTAEPQPELYWYVSKPVGISPELTILADGGVDPLVETSLPAPATAGVQRVALASLGKRLEPGKEYRWFVTLVNDKTSRSKDEVASGRITYMPASRELVVRWSNRGPAEKAAAMAADGYWYDVVAILEAAGLYRHTAALYESAGLRDVARHARSRR